MSGRPLKLPGNPPPTSPYVWQVLDSQQRLLSLTVPYDNTTHQINAPVTVHRDANCAYTRILIDVGADGTPNSTTKILNVSNLVGDRTFTVAQVNAIGVFTLEDVKAHSLTAS